MFRKILKNSKSIFVFILWGAIVILVAPWIYRNVFISEEGFILKGHTCRIPSSLGDFKFGKDVFLDVRFLNNNYLLSELNIKELELGGVRLSGDIVVKGRLIEKDEGSVFSGKLFSRNISLNSRLSMKVSSQFKIKDDTLEIESLRLGRSYDLKGTVNLVNPFITDLVLEIRRGDMRDFAVIANAKNPDVALGSMNGIFYIKGELKNLFSSGMLHSRNGKIGSLEYDVANARLEGSGPIINLVDTYLRHGSSRLTINGYIDLRNIAKGEDLFGGLRGTSDMKEIVWDGWDITKSGASELRMTKSISDYMQVGFKTMAREPLTTYYDNESPEEMSLEYKMGLKNVKMKFKENEEFLGIEHNVEF